jgi:hypothetical protein
MEYNPLQSQKAASPIIFTVFGIIVFLQPNSKQLSELLIIALQLFRESYIELPASTWIEFNPEQLRNVLDADNQ